MQGYQLRLLVVSFFLVAHPKCIHKVPILAASVAFLSVTFPLTFLVQSQLLVKVSKHLKTRFWVHPSQLETTKSAVRPRQSEYSALSLPYEMPGRLPAAGAHKNSGWRARGCHTHSLPKPVHPVGKVSATSIWKQITMGRYAFRKSQKSVQNYANQHGTHSGDTLAIPRRYPKMEKRNPSPPIPLIISTQPHLQISKGENPTQSHSPIPNGTDTLGKFRTYKNAGKNINVPNHVFQNTSWTQHAPTSRNLSPQLDATNNKASERIEFPNGVYP